MNSKERFINACLRKPVDRPPVWLMRQAGRYLPEYRLIRARHGFTEMCKDPKLACEVSLQPWQRYGMDAVIVFSDILFVPEAMGMELSFKEGSGPKLSPAITKPTQIAKLKKVDAKKAFSFVYDTIRILKKKLPNDVPVIGFSGSPWTLAYYMTDDRAEEWIDKNPKSLHQLLDKTTKVVTDYVKLQQEAGADVIQLFDTWAGELSKEDFVSFSATYNKEIITNGKVDAPFIIYSRQCSHILEELAATGADVVSIDPETSMEDAIDKIGSQVALQGNIDPKTMLTSPGAVKEETSRLLSQIRGRYGHIINLGHGILPTTQLECVEALIETVKHG